jgi:predicted DNA-binding transcriptional regulator AlpA
VIKLSPSKRYLRKRDVAARYGAHERSVDRMCRDGRIPRPLYLPGSRIPLWDEATLDLSDRRATVERSAKTAA